MMLNTSEASACRRQRAWSIPDFSSGPGRIRSPKSRPPVGAELAAGADPDALIDDVRTLADAGRQHRHSSTTEISAAARRRPRPAPASSRRRFAARVPAATAALVTHAALPRLRPGAAALLSRRACTRWRPWPRQAPAHRSDRQARGGRPVEPGAVIGREAQIGRGTRIAAGAVIGYRVTIGRDCYIGPRATVTHALIGDRVIIHSGVRIGQDGFGFAMGPGGHLKVPQIGRVIIQDDVEIGANTTIDRGALRIP